MPTNPYFDNFSAENEQTLIEDLIVEAIQQYGLDMVYIPRNLENLDRVFTEDDQSTYTDAYQIEMYIKNVEGFAGDGQFMDKWSMEIRDQIILSVARRSFEKEITKEVSALIRPREGDVIWSPMNKKLFQIKFVQNYEVWYQAGTLQTWDLTCELFEYSNETFDTGLPEVDAIMKYSTDLNEHAIITEGSNPLSTPEEPIGDRIVAETYDPENVQAAPSSNKYIEQAANTVVDWSSTNPFGEPV